LLSPEHFGCIWENAVRSQFSCEMKPLNLSLFSEGWDHKWFICLKAICLSIFL
jgi:hypothetical protein